MSITTNLKELPNLDQSKDIIYLQDLIEYHSKQAVESMREAKSHFLHAVRLDNELNLIKGGSHGA